MKKTTEWRDYPQPYSGKYRLRVTYGFDEAFAKRNNQEPYFSITAESERFAGGWREDCGGQMHDAIREVFPELAPMIRWHLVNVSGIPMHYLANGVYWWELCQGTSRWKATTDPIAAFKSTIVYGLPGDSETFNPFYSNEQLTGWLVKRQPQLLKSMRADIPSEVYPA